VILWRRGLRHWEERWACRATTASKDLLRPAMDEIIDMDTPLVRLAKEID
jgi:hypothetical protein